MTETPQHKLDLLLAEFRDMNGHDHKAILRNLPESSRALLIRKLDDRDLSSEDDDGEASSPDPEYAPWLVSCLNPGKRMDIPAFRKDFAMTSSARESLKKAMGETGSDGLTASKLNVLPRDEASVSDQKGPPLMSRLAGFLSQKAATP